MVSIKDVAKHAGVAISTVSKVVNHYPNVSEETIQRVNAAIEELQFVPNSIAASLSSKQSARIALLINPITQTQAIDEIAMQYLTGAIHKAQDLKVDVIPLFFSMLENKSIEEVESYLRAQNIGGIIIYGMSKDDVTLHELIRLQKFKIVCVDAPFVNENTSYVAIDHKLAQKQVARKTIADHGNRILYIAGKKNGYVSEERLQGMEELAKEMQLELFVQGGEFREKLAREITLQYAKDQDVVVCASDLMAIGSMKALIDMDIFRPVCGFDGITLMGYVGKQMYTIRQNFREISAMAVEECRRLMHGGQKGRSVRMPHELVRLEYLEIIC
ncbi:MAG: LacI family DNA-binding transcriptional regulator [Lachnospiraceae bacterium]|nr:LacI family DNA-binding transcriptional regulator [Lachnospiraceae bacterium]